MRCLTCGSENPEGLKFCTECGAALPNRCPSCGFENPLRAKFCGECGAALTRPPFPASPMAYTPPHLVERILAEQAALEARAAPEGERKTVTALFADIKGSMGLMEDRDPPTFAPMPDTPERAHQELTLRLALGPALMALQGFAAAEVEQVYLRARELCQQVEEIPQLFTALFGLFGFQAMIFVSATMLSLTMLSFNLGPVFQHRAVESASPDAVPPRAVGSRIRGCGLNELPRQRREFNLVKLGLVQK